MILVSRPIKMKQEDIDILAFATSRSVVRRALRVALFVGVILALLNHGDRILTGTLNSATILKIMLTFLVPYCVSTYSSVLAVKEGMQTLTPDENGNE